MVWFQLGVNPHLPTQRLEVTGVRRLAWVESRAPTVDNLTGNGVLTSIGALSVWHLCPHVSGEDLEGP